MSDSESDDGSSSKKETLSKMKQRHKREMQELQKKIRNEIASIGNAKKNDKRLAKEKGEKAEKDLLAKHAEEIASLAKAQSADDDDEEAETATSIETPASAPAPAPETKQPEENTKKTNPSRAQQRKANKLAKEKARRAEIEEELKDVVDPRAVENQALAQKLASLSLTVQEIRSDGHCLFRAIEDQLVKRGYDKDITTLSVVQLRKMAADHIRTHPDDFAPFMSDADGNMLTPEEFAAYCDKLTADSEPVMWGGHSEIVALSSVLRKPIVVHSADGAPLLVGEQFGTGRVDDKSALHVSFHRHYYGLGEHYNSVVDVEEQDED